MAAPQGPGSFSPDQLRTFDTLAVLPFSGLGLGLTPRPGFRHRVAAERHKAGPFLIVIEAYADDAKQEVSLEAAFALKGPSFLGFRRIVSSADGWCPYRERDRWLRCFASILRSVRVKER